MKNTETNTSIEKGLETSNESQNRQSERSHTKCMFSKSNFVAFRTVPVILKNGNRKIRVNALLDDASTTSFVNADVAAELGLQGKMEKITTSILNDRTETFVTMPVELGLESTDGNIDMILSAYTATKVTGDLQVVDWQKVGSSWSHLQSIDFPKTVSPPIVDILIGMDYPNLHFSHKDVCAHSI